MIPTIGVMIGGYVIFRCLEAICRNTESFGSAGKQRFIQVMAVIGIVVSGALTLDLMLSGSSSALPGIR